MVSMLSKYMALTISYKTKSTYSILYTTHASLSRSVSKKVRI